MLQDKRVLLIIGGGIAAYKALDVIRRLRERGADVRCVLTSGGAEFITPLSVAALSENQVFSSLFDLKDESEMGHIRLSREADVVLVAPATADLMAKAANGLAGDLASTVLLATDKPVLMAPSMNTRMWEHAATQRNMAQLKADGIGFIAPSAGELACGEVGTGRLAEVTDIVDAVAAFLSPAAKPLAGRRALVTAGPTHEPIDPVRYIANRSSGRQGYAIASALSNLGAHTVLVSGPTQLEPPRGVETVQVETALEMQAACEKALPADVAVCVAAVADWRSNQQQDEKMKKSDGPMSALSLVENPDILAGLSKPSNRRPKLVVGFAAETCNVIEYATQKRARKGCDWIVANDVSPKSGVVGGVMGGKRNQVHVITGAGSETWPDMPKQAVAMRLADKIAAALTA
ncbi:MAG: bifunctional phosphopantothenoylcysteine decarboxylase/phosphopantothenate--cysteine ligase CoaBC [Pseudomonadota bacterium]